MKRILPVLLATTSVISFGETIRIGTMELPLRFEGEPPTGAVHHFATNEIVRYYHSVIGFLGLSPDASQPAPINEMTKATMVWQSPVFQDKVSFYVESGLTNCVVSATFVTNAAAIYAEWNERTNLAASAEAFLQSVSSANESCRVRGSVSPIRFLGSDYQSPDAGPSVAAPDRIAGRERSCSGSRERGFGERPSRDVLPHFVGMGL